ncbi:CotH kinase family protein [Bacillus rubiinfantis]|uniref:CotH kinase family protein n=1 Tax=Bacillus rubiinfantis TaxID=1499680 RepID=UPI0005AA3375|nr:CotH kinase family protein [Bacillus rubiinfantis]
MSLPHYKLFIRPNYFRELNRDIWIDEPVPGVLKVEDKRFEIDVCYRGSHIRTFPKKSFHLFFYKPKRFNGSKEIHLNSEYMDPSLVRNKLSFDFFKEIGVLAPEAQHVFLTVNGKGEGIYLEIESVDENFLKKRNLPSGSIYYAVDGDANFSLMSDLDKGTKKSLKAGYEGKWLEDEAAEFHLQEFIFKINTIPPDEFQQEITKFLDVEQYLKWVAGIIFTSNYDGFVHNYALYRNGETGLFTVIPWDYDATWGRDVNGKPMEVDYVPIAGFNTLTARLMAVDTYREYYQSLLKDIMTHQFTHEFLMPHVEKLLQSIQPYFIKDPYTSSHIEQLDEENEIIFKYIEERRRFLQQELAQWN